MFSIDIKAVLVFLISGLLKPAFPVEPTIENIIYGMDRGTALLMDVYQPETPNGADVVFIMGIGFSVYGEYYDLAVDISQSKILHASLNASGIPNQLLILPGNNRSELGKATGPLPFSRAASWLLEQFDRSAGIAVQHSKSL